MSEEVKLVESMLVGLLVNSGESWIAIHIDIEEEGFNIRLSPELARIYANALLSFAESAEQSQKQGD